MSTILELLQNLRTRVHRKKARVPLRKNEKEVLRLRILGQALRGLHQRRWTAYLPPSS
jgi:hypothetical protein